MAQHHAERSLVHRHPFGDTDACKMVRIEDETREAFALSALCDSAGMGRLRHLDKGTAEGKVVHIAAVV